MEHRSPDSEFRSLFAQDLNRRRLFIGVGAVAALGLVPQPGFAAQTATPPAVDQARLTQMTDLSKTLCGGGTFDSGLAAMLLRLLDGDADLSRGLDELLANPRSASATSSDATATPPAAERSTQAQSAAEAILLFWYTGSFNGDPISDRSANYTQLLAWQAMYTPAWTTCKLYGAWAEAPTSTPQVPENT